MLMSQKNIFDRYYCMKTFCRSKTLEKLHRKVSFPVPIMARKSTLPANVLKTHLMMMTSVFVTAPEYLFVNRKAVH